MQLLQAFQSLFSLWAIGAELRRRRALLTSPIRRASTTAASDLVRLGSDKGSRARLRDLSTVSGHSSLRSEGTWDSCQLELKARPVFYRATKPEASESGEYVSSVIGNARIFSAASLGDRTSHPVFSTVSTALFA